MRVHVVAYWAYYGVKPTKCICHTCDNTACCNPNHLFEGTHLENMQDKVRKGRQFKMVGEEHPMSKLGWSVIKEIRQEYSKGGITQRQLAKKFGISQANVNDIVLKKIWK